MIQADFQNLVDRPTLTDLVKRAEEQARINQSALLAMTLSQKMFYTQPSQQSPITAVLSYSHEQQMVALTQLQCWMARNGSEIGLMTLRDVRNLSNGWHLCLTLVDWCQVCTTLSILAIEQP
jgi:hypothetical protein